MTIQNRKHRRAANAAGRRKGATGGRPKRRHHIADGGVCPPGAPCCAAVAADRAFFEREPAAKTMLRERIVGEFGELDERVERLCGPRFLVLVVRLREGIRRRRPITRADAAELARALDAADGRGRS